MRTSPLDAEHRALGAKMVPFGGWEMPLSYPLGTLGEHAACRDHAAIFDVSHLGTVRVEGSAALATLQSNLTNDLERIAPGRAQYTHLLDPNDGSVLDDIIVWWISQEVFDVMPNASNTERVVSAIGGTDTTHERAVLALQGPDARRVVGTLCAEAAEVPRFHVREVEILGAPCTVAGTGYTGEDGIEIAVPAAHAARIWGSCIEAGFQPAGLGARDTLRLEAALPLHGHELGPGITPLQAGLEWVVSWKKPGFRGREALLAEKERGVRRILRGVAVPGRRPARDGAVVKDKDGRILGTVTSGNFSPSLGHCIALALVEPSAEVGTDVVLDVRGTGLPGRLVKTPFVAKKSS